jgi:uncharacterized membrane protein
MNGAAATVILGFSLILWAVCVRVCALGNRED